MFCLIRTVADFEYVLDFRDLRQFLKIALQVICGIFLGRFLLSFFLLIECGGL